jgi:hypothetical protein
MPFDQIMTLPHPARCMRVAHESHCENLVDTKLGPSTQAAGSSPAPATERRRTVLARELGLAWLHLAVLWAFAFAKPLFDVLADSPEFFVARGNTRSDIVILALALVIVAPTLLVAVELAAARVPSVRHALHLLFVGSLSAAFAVQVLDDAVGGSSALLILVALGLGAAAAFAYARVRAVPSILTVLSPAPLLFLLLFLFGSDVSKLVLPQDSASAADADIRSDTPVVMVVFDEFDPNMLMDAEQRIDRTRYPNFAAFAEDATWYRNASTVNTQTTMAVPAILSGRRPRPDLLPVAADYPNSLPTLLADSHRMKVTETATEVCPSELCGGRARDPAADRLRDLTKDLGIVSLHLLAPEGMEHRLPSVDKTFADFGGGGRDEAQPQQQPDVPASALNNRPDQWNALLRGIKAQGGRPTLSFLHAALPHIPWQYLPSGQQYINAGPDYPGLDNEQWSADPVPARLGMQRHLLQVGYVDRLVGRLMDRLKRAGLYRRAMVILTADHGVSYQPGHGRRSPDATTASDILGVPLLIKYPGRDGGVADDVPVRTIDIVPTIAHALGVDLPWEADGRPIGTGAPLERIQTGIGASGKVLTISVDDFERDRRAALMRMIGTFGSGDGGRGLYAGAGNGDLIGRPVDELAGSAPGSVELDSSDLLDRHRPGARLVPSFLSGQIAGGPGPGASLAIAVNGTVRATAEAFENDGEVRMAAVVPPSSFRTGSNSVEVFLVRGSGAGRRLLALSTDRPEAFRLAERDGETVIEGEGRSFDVEEGRLTGYVDSFELDDQGVRLGGWAVDPDAKRAVDRILVFAGGRLVAQGEPTLVRPDISGRFGPEAARSGFELRAAVPDGEGDAVRAFAIAGDAASELPRWDG